MAEEVRAPQPQNPAVDPELPQPPPPQQVEIREPGPLVVPIVIRDPEGALRESAAGQGVDPLPGRTTLFDPAEVFQPVGVPLEGDAGLGRTTPGFDGSASVFQPIGVPLEGDIGIGRTTPGFDVPSVFQPIGVPVEGDVGLGVTTPGFDGAAPPFLPNADAQAANDTIAALRNAQDQATTEQRYNQTTEGDWRVRIRLLAGANYLYMAPNPGILAPLKNQDGVIFPYTPTLTTNYRANYDSYELTHSNIRGYFYKNSSVSEIGINGDFTAQDTREAEYLLAVIHFFRSVTKMFYGQDEFRGAPPPVVTLSGYGQYQFNAHPCLVSNFNYSLPSDVDYIRVNPNNQGISLAPRQPRQANNPLTISSVVNRLLNAGLPRGAVAGSQDLGFVNQTVDATGQTTYVPTKIQLQLTLLPLQTRSQVSKQFSLAAFASGTLLSKGFW